jgi:hypothetical protein
VIGAVAMLAIALPICWWAFAAHAGDPGLAGRRGAAARTADAGPEEAAGTQERDALAEAAGTGCFSAPAGSEFGYEFAALVRSGVEVALASQPVAQRLVLRLHGTMNVLVVARRADELIARLDLSGVTASQGVGGAEERSPALEELLALPAFVRMRDDGALVGFAFDERSNGFVNNLVRSIACGFRFVVPASAMMDSAQKPWTGEEADPTGIATVRYDWLDDARDERRLQRTKTAYRGSPGQRSDLALGYEVRSNALATLSSALGWLRSAQVGETLTARADTASLRSTTDYEASIALVTHRRRSPAELPDAPWDQRWAGLAGLEDTNAIAESSERELSELELGGATLASLVQDIEGLTAGRPLDTAALTAASHKLSVLLRLHPEALAELGRVLPTASPFAADVMLGAVGAAGTVAAQQFLAGVATDAGAAPGLRQSALESMIQLAAPTDAVLAAVRQVADDPDAGAGLRNKSLLVLGALASRQPQSDSIDRDGLVAELVGREDRARSAGQLEHWLHALGNTGNPDALPAIERYLGNDDVDVRHAAVYALRQVDTESATRALLDRAGSERDERVRALAIEGLAQRNDASGLDYIGGVLDREPREDLRRAAVAGLGRQLPGNQAVVPMLQRTAQNDRSPEVRDLAARTLQSRNAR